MKITGKGIISKLRAGQGLLFQLALDISPRGGRAGQISIIVAIPDTDKTDDSELSSPGHNPSPIRPNPKPQPGPKSKGQIGTGLTQRSHGV